MQEDSFRIVDFTPLFEATFFKELARVPARLTRKK